MKSPFTPSCRNSQRGVALVIVLSVLLLMSGMLVAFMGRVSSERSSQRATAATFEAKQAYESAVNLVMSQIREATRDGSGTTGWASQPGVIRTFDNSGKDAKVFKLYSHEQLQVSASAYNPSTPAESGLMPGDPERLIDSSYVNLNEPAFTPIPGQKDRVQPHYPIVDPYARRDYSNNPNGVEPSIPGKGSVQGFHCIDIKHRSGVFGPDGKPVLDLPMRVKWLYHMRDGTVSAANSEGVIAGATKDNPPVARVAFWTDDESAKINLNTAAENTYWDVPAASTIQESGRIDGSAQVVYSPTTSLHLSSSQPARDEFQRYPGHPATTNLSPALRWLFPKNWTDKQFKEALFRLLPRITGGVGTSVSGSQNAWALYFNPNSGVRFSNTDPRVTERDRLFATLDEFWFRPDRSPITSAGFYPVFRDPNQERSPGGATRDPVIPDVQSRFGLTASSVLERMRFFLTTVSRSSDLNMYGKPRIPIWSMADQKLPPPLGQDRRSAFDDVIAFTATVARKTYHFARTKAWDPTYDFEQAGRDNFNDGSPNGRNKKIFAYLQSLTDKVIPGTDRSFASKYQSDRDQILVEIFDYIRSTNLIDTGNKDPDQKFPPVGTTPYPYAYTPGYDLLEEGSSSKYSGSAKSIMGSGQVIPTIRNNGENRGFGRFVTLSESGIAFYVDRGPNIPGLDTEIQTNPSDVPVRAILLSEFFTPSPGYAALSEAYAYTVELADPNKDFLFEPTDPQKPRVPLRLARPNNANFVEVDAARGPDGRFFMPTRGFGNQFWFDQNINGSKTLKRIDVNAVDNPLGSGDYSKYPFISKKFYVTPPNPNSLPTSFRFTPAAIRYDIYTLAVPDNQLPPHPKNPVPWRPKAGAKIQSITVNFAVNNGVPAPMTVQMPAEFMGAEPNTKGIINVVGKVYNQTNTRTLPNGSQSTQRAEEDWRRMAIRSKELNGEVRADIRHAMASYEVPAAYFSEAGPVGAYASTTLHAHNFRAGWGRRYSNAGIGNIVPGQKHRTGSTDKVMKFPVQYAGGLQGVLQRIPDFDRGMSKHTDGPFINKPDEGNIRFKADDSPSTGGSMPYFRGGGGYDEVGSNFFAPNRVVPSAVMFGSLPSGIKAKRPWQTLLFSPEVGSHIGAQSPKDHYLLDLFTMPVIEPYAISEPLSTGGRINLNARIAPFGYAKVGGRSYIERSTGLHAVLKGMYQFAIHNSAEESGHSEHPLTGQNSGRRYRMPIDPFATIEKVINPKFDTAPGYFRSATQICELDLLLDHTTPGYGVPPPPGAPSFDDSSKRTAFWTATQLTGDNNRERPYAHIYPRLTTKSNTYTVHAWAQSIAKNPATPDEDWNKFDESKDRILGEYRGSSTIERFIDPNDDAIVDMEYDAVRNLETTGMDPFYRFRIVNHKRFVVQ